jgi:Response regulator containing CheY-like receiver domain and AraC-type DNA-binding domain
MNHELLNVLLIDDESLIRDLLRRCICWNEMGMRIVGEAGTAEEAVKLVDRLAPDIIFTDICMPLMDGIEFSRQTLLKYPFIKIIIVTGYDKFDYAKRSIKAGVSDFISKPIDDEEIIRVLKNLRNKIEAEQAQQDEYCRAKKQLEENLPFLKERFLNELLINKMTETQFAEQLGYYQIEVQSDFYQAAVAEMVFSGNNEEERLMLRFQIMDQMKTMMKDEKFYQVFFDPNQRIVVLYNGVLEEEIIEWCKRIQNIILKQYPISFGMGIGTSHRSNEIRDSYHEACEALKYQILLGKNQIICFSDIHSETSVQSNFQVEPLDMFGFYLKAGLELQALESLDDLYRVNDGNKTSDIETIRIAAVHVISIVFKVLAEIGANIVEIQDHSSDPYAVVFRMNTYPEVKTFLENLTRETIQTVQLLRNRKANKAIQQIENYLIHHYADSELSLADVAKVHFLNPSYLSRIFKQNTGQSFVEYLTRIRMEKAIRLLTETNLKAYEIAEKVGITNPYYFSFCFKKFTGKSINEYKNNR